MCYKINDLELNYSDLRWDALKNGQPFLLSFNHCILGYPIDFNDLAKVQKLANNAQQHITAGREEVLVMTTGGTIDKSYDEFDGSLANKESQIKQRILSRLRMPYTEIRVFSLMAKDSLHMTDYDRTLILKTIQTHLPKEKPIVILHGTDTMAKTAKVVYDALKDSPELKVPIVFTGAMKPMGFEDSDSYQNVTEALLAVKLLRPGVYISFHNRVFELPKVRKNKEKRTFESYE